MIVGHEQILIHLAQKMQGEFQKTFKDNELEINIDSMREIGISTSNGLFTFDIFLSGTYVYNQGFKHGCYDLDMYFSDKNEELTLDISNDEFINKLNNLLYED